MAEPKFDVLTQAQRDSDGATTKVEATRWAFRDGRHKDVRKLHADHAIQNLESLYGIVRQDNEGG